MAGPYLVLHVGLNKTATTLMQSELFPSSENYVGRFYKPSSPRPLDLGRKLRDIYLGSKLMWPSRLRAWATQLPPTPPPEGLLVSDESLVSWRNQAPYVGFDFWSYGPRLRPHPLADFLKVLVRSSNWNLKIALVVRNQPDWLGSIYAHQQTIRRKRGDSKDFIYKWRHYTKRRDTAFDWNLLIEELDSAVGAENVTVLPYEIGPLTIARQIMALTGVGDSYSMDTSLPRVNSRRLYTHSWRLEASDVPISALTPLWLRLGPGRLLPTPLLKSYGKAWSRLDSALIRASATRSTPEKLLSLSDQTVTEIRSFHSLSNQKLALRVQIDLEELGY